MPDVKRSRRYDASRRQEQARRTQDAILAAARSELLRSGYAGTTVARIAAEAGTSVETVYKAFGGKAGLVRALWDRGLAGSQEVTASNRSDELSTTSHDPVAVIRGWAGFSAELAPEVSPIMLLIRAAATSEPDMAALLADADAQRRARMQVNARRLRARGWLRKGVTTRLAADILWTYSSADMYELLVLKSGWPLNQYRRFLGDAMIAALLPPECSNAAV